MQQGWWDNVTTRPGKPAQSLACQFVCRSLFQVFNSLAAAELLLAHFAPLFGSFQTIGSRSLSDVTRHKLILQIALTSVLANWDLQEPAF